MKGHYIIFQMRIHNIVFRENKKDDIEILSTTHIFFPTQTNTRRYGGHLGGIQVISLLLEL